jgi:hypothetical protein
MWARAARSLPLALAIVALGASGAQAAGPVQLLDNRGWELVPPVDKNGGEVQGFASSGNLLQAAAAGGAVGFGSTASFGADALGAPAVSQYLSRRGEGGWMTRNVTVPQLSAGYGEGPGSNPYRLFSGDLSGALLSNGQRCRGIAGECAVANPPLAGSGAPAGYRNYYLRSDGSGTFQALLTSSSLAFTPLPAARFELSFAGASPDLRHVVVSTCAALTAEATEVPAGAGCDLAEPNLYEWSDGALRLVNLLPGAAQGSPGAELAAPAGAIADDGGRVYFKQLEDGAIYLREAGGPTRLVPGTIGGGAQFQVASGDGSVAYFTSGGHLWRYDVAGSGSSTDLTPDGGVSGVLGASSDGAYVYYQDGAGLRLWRSPGMTTTVAPGADAADPGDSPPATGTARVSADGTKLLFLSKASLTGYDNADQVSGQPDSEAYLYDANANAGAGSVSCNPTLARPLGPSTIPGAIGGGEGADAVPAYKPRAFSADGQRLFFDSEDALVLQDTNNGPDVYEWEANGAGSCRSAGGCLQLISNGRGEAGASFADASADGDDAYFLSDAPLVPSDPGSIDLYDARVGGGFPIPPAPIPCEGDACQPLPSPPEDPTPGTLAPGPPNPPRKVVTVGKKQAQKKASHKRHGKRGKGSHRKAGRR